MPADERWLSFSPEFFRSLSQILSRGNYYLVILLTVGAVLFVDMMAEYVRSQYFPSAIDVQRELDRNLGDGAKAAWGDEDTHGGAAVAPLAVEAGADGAAAPAPAADVPAVAASPALVLRAVTVQGGRGRNKVASESASSRSVAQPPLGVVVLDNPARGAPASPSSIAVVEVPEAAAALPALAPIKIPALPPPMPPPMPPPAPPPAPPPLAPAQAQAQAPPFPLKLPPLLPQAAAAPPEEQMVF